MRLYVFKSSAYALSALAVLAFAAPSFAQGHSGGASGAHMSTQGTVNTNGPNSADRDKGHARAQDRSHSKTQSHSMAQAPHAKAGVNGNAKVK